MSFEEQIRVIARKIYEKVINLINENKEDDDIYYRSAFIKLNDGIELSYNPEYINIIYDTSLVEKVENEDREDIENIKKIYLKENRELQAYVLK